MTDEAATPRPWRVTRSKRLPALEPGDIAIEAGWAIGTQDRPDVVAYIEEGWGARTSPPKAQDKERNRANAQLIVECVNAAASTTHGDDSSSTLTRDLIAALKRASAYIPHGSKYSGSFSEDHVADAPKSGDPDTPCATCGHPFYYHQHDDHGGVFPCKPAHRRWCGADKDGCESFVESA